MANSSSMKFGDIMQEERYKRLERNLKLAYLKKWECLKSRIQKNCSPLRLSSMSSICTDEFNSMSSTSEKSHIQTSGGGSDVVSSSLNLRNYTKRKPMATSSVKNYPAHKFDRDRAIMPPPVLRNPVYSNKKKVSRVMDSEFNVQEKQCENLELDKELLNCSNSMNSAAILSKNDLSTISSISNHKSCRNFFDWRVILNHREELIIKGTLECGRIGRSKPIIQRLSCTNVQSLYKHIYILNGHLVDNRCELPDYIRQKFYNGFPDDWQNVYQLWREYVVEGSPVTFRWPTHVTDSDDDINSQVTDVTYFKQTIHKKKSHVSNTALKNTSLGNHAKLNIPENQTNLEHSKKENINSISPKIPNTSKTIGDSGHCSEIRDISTNNDKYIANSSNKCIHCTTSNSSNSNLKNTSYLYEIIREDKLRIILSNLGDKNCPPQYLDKFIDFINCLRYLLSNTPSMKCDADNKSDNSLLWKNEVQEPQKCNKTSFTEEQEVRLQSQLNTQNYNESVKSNEIKNHSENPENNVLSNSLESDRHAKNSPDISVYMGIPKMNLNDVLLSKIQQFQFNKNRKCKRNSNTNKKKQLQEQIEFDKNDELHQYSDIDISEYKFQPNEQLSSKSKLSPVLASNDTEKKGFKQRDVETAIVAANENKCTKFMQNKSVKPVIRNSEIVHYNIKLIDSRKTEKSTNDIAINNAETDTSKQTLANLDKISRNNIKNNKDDYELNDELSEDNLLQCNSDFENEDQFVAKHSKNQSKNGCQNNLEQEKIQNKEFKKLSIKIQKMKPNEQLSLSSEKNKIPLNNKIGKNEQPYGSKKNPKLLSSWTPCVVYDNAIKKQCGLRFEGKLLNEAGLVIDKIFITDSINTRHSSKLIETVSKDYFMLVGDLVNKHLVPKELVKQCLVGCPLKIKEFCQEWMNLKEAFKKPTNNKLSKLSEVPIDVLKIPISSRGRPLIPPLNYWQGERIMTKNLSTVYRPGNTIESSLPSKTLMSNNKKKENEKSNPNKRLKIENESPISSRRRKVVKKKLDETSFSNTSENSDDELRLNNVKHTAPINCINDLRSRNCTRRDSQKSEANYNTRTKASTNNTTKLTWTFEKGEYVDILSDDLASLR